MDNAKDRDKTSRNECQNEAERSSPNDGLDMEKESLDGPNRGTDEAGTSNAVPSAEKVHSVATDPDISLDTTEAPPPPLLERGRRLFFSPGAYSIRPTSSSSAPGEDLPTTDSSSSLSGDESVSPPVGGPGRSPEQMEQGVDILVTATLVEPTPDEGDARQASSVLEVVEALPVAVDCHNFHHPHESPMEGRNGRQLKVVLIVGCFTIVGLIIALIQTTLHDDFYRTPVDSKSRSDPSYGTVAPKVETQDDLYSLSQAPTFLSSTSLPTIAPSIQPSPQPSLEPSLEPTQRDSSSPSTNPSQSPTRSPSLRPTSSPTRSSALPSAVPTPAPSLSPTMLESHSTTSDDSD